MSTTADLGDGEVLWRRVHKDHYQNGRVISAAFKDFELSVDRAVIQQDPTVTLKDGEGLAEFTAQEARSFEQDPVAEPLPGGLAHALVIGHKPRSISRAMSKLARFTPREDLAP